MPRRRQDRFVREVVGIKRASQRRKAKRATELADGEKSALQFNLENAMDIGRSKTQELAILGGEVGKGVLREFGSLGKDFLLTFCTLGLVESASMRNGRRWRRKRRL